MYYIDSFQNKIKIFLAATDTAGFYGLLKQDATELVARARTAAARRPCCVILNATNIGRKNWTCRLPKGVGVCLVYAPLKYPFPQYDLGPYLRYGSLDFP